MARNWWMRAVVERQREDAAAGAVLIHQQVEREILDEELRRAAQRLAVERVQHGVAGAVGGGARALRRRAFAELRRHAAERALVDLAVLGARERHAVVLHLVHGGRRVAAEVFDGVLVAEPVGALHRVVHVPAPVVRPHVAERRGDAALRRDRVRARGKHLRHARRLEAGLGAAERCAQAGAAGADDDDIVGVIVDGIRQAVDGRGRAGLFRAVGFGRAVLLLGHRPNPRSSISARRRSTPPRCRRRRACCRAAAASWRLRRARSPR